MSQLTWNPRIDARDPRKPAEPPSYVKICGILANCSYTAGNYQIVLGIGINTNNGRPTIDLDSLLPGYGTAGAPASFRVETLIARILARLEVLYAEFRRDGFSRDIEARYYQHWLHTGQKVTLEAEGGVRARVLGITTDWGMLKAEELNLEGRATGRILTLQSDENSFDYWKGLVKKKT
jgi:biotin--protein ligase